MHPEIPVEEITIPMFEPEEIALADAFPVFRADRIPAPWAPATISVDLNSEDPAYVCLVIESPGEAVLAREPYLDLRLTTGALVDLRPADALELAARLRAFGEAAAAFLARYPDAPAAETSQPAATQADP